MVRHFVSDLLSSFSFLLPSLSPSSFLLPVPLVPSSSLCSALFLFFSAFSFFLPLGVSLCLSVSVRREDEEEENEESGRGSGAGAAVGSVGRRSVSRRIGSVAGGADLLPIIGLLESLVSHVTSDEKERRRLRRTDLLSPSPFPLPPPSSLFLLSFLFCSVPLPFSSVASGIELSPTFRS